VVVLFLSCLVAALLSTCTFCLFFGFVIGFWGCARNTYLTTWGAMTLQGPHQVAKKSTTITPDSLRAASKSALLHSREDIMLVFCAARTRTGSQGSACGRATSWTYEVRLWTPVDMLEEYWRVWNV